MAVEDLVQALKQIITLSRTGREQETYEAYRFLFADPGFMAHPPEHQRKALKLMIHAKRRENIPPPHVVEAHRAALGPLSELVGGYGEPADFEMLGLCHVITGDEASASAAFKAGLDIERTRNPQSDLCGALMKWVASV